MLRWRSSIAFVLLVGCRTAMAQNDASSVRDTDLIHDALMARVSYPSGCEAFDWVDTFSNPYFPGVQFVRGSCLQRHGARTSAVVATDSAHVVYVLGSDSGIRFLMRRHPVSSIDSANALGYTRLLLEMRGETSAADQIVTSMDEVVPDAIAKLRASLGTKLLTRVTGVVHGRTGDVIFLTITAQGPNLLRRFEVTVNPDGAISYRRTILWEGDRSNP